MKCEMANKKWFETPFFVSIRDNTTYEPSAHTVETYPIDSVISFQKGNNKTTG